MTTTKIYQQEKAAQRKIKLVIHFAVHHTSLGINPYLVVAVGEHFHRDDERREDNNLLQYSFLSHAIHPQLIPVWLHYTVTYFATIDKQLR